MGPEPVPASPQPTPPWVHWSALGLSLGVAGLTLIRLPLAWLSLIPLALGVWALLGAPLPASGRRAALFGSSLAALLLMVAMVDFTLREAAPGIIEAGRRASSRQAVSSLRFIYSAELRFKEEAYADSDGDGVGEFAFLGELAGNVMIRGARPALSPPLLAHPFQSVVPGDRGGAMVSGAYCYAVYLPAAKGAASEAGTGGIGATAVLPEVAERHFIAYAWPLRWGQTGELVYAIDEREMIVESMASAEQRRYSGLEHMPAWDAALPEARFGAPLGGEATGDGGSWHPWKGKKARTSP